MPNREIARTTLERNLTIRGIQELSLNTKACHSHRDIQERSLTRACHRDIQERSLTTLVINRDSRLTITSTQDPRGKEEGC